MGMEDLVVDQGRAGVSTRSVETSTNQITSSVSKMADQVSSTVKDIMGTLPQGQEFVDLISVNTLSW